MAALLKPHPQGIPLPSPTVVSRPYWEACRRGELLYQRCQGCGRPVFNPATICRWCNSIDLQWKRAHGTGTVYSWSTVWRPQTPAFAVPYVAAIIDVDEGYQMIANIIGCEPDAVYCGMKVAVEFHPIGGGFSLPYFRPVD